MNNNTTSKPLLWIALAGITMFFAGITSAVIVSRPTDSWIHFPIPDWFLYSTFVIITSSLLLVIAKDQIKKDNPTETKVRFCFIERDNQKVQLLLSVLIYER